MIALKLGTDALKHPLSIFEGRLQSFTCDTRTRRNGAIRQSVTMRCVTGVSTAAAVGNCCATRAAKASRPFGDSRHLPLALAEGARSLLGEDYCSRLVSCIHVSKMGELERRSATDRANLTTHRRAQLHACQLPQALQRFQPHPPHPRSFFKRT